MPLGALPATYSGLSVSQRKIRVTANNVANVNTDGFRTDGFKTDGFKTDGFTKSRTVLSTAQPHGAKAEVEQVETTGPSALEQTTQGEQSVERSDLDARAETNVDIGEEMVNLLSGQRGYEASLRTLKTADEMVGSLLDVVADEER